MKRLLMSVTITVALSSSMLAGDIPSGGIPSQDSEGMPTATLTSSGEVLTVGVAEQLTSDALSTLVTMLGFLTV